jgi:hypothetical protein
MRDLSPSAWVIPRFLGKRVIKDNLAFWPSKGGLLGYLVFLQYLSIVKGQVRNSLTAILKLREGGIENDKNKEN